MRGKTKEFWYAVGELLAKLARGCNYVVFRFFPFVALGLVGYSRIPDAVACLAWWAFVVTGRMTINPPATTKILIRKTKKG